MTYEIEKNIPLPERNPNCGRSKYPLSRMEIGDSFLIPEFGGSKQPQMHSSAHRLGIKVSCRVTEEGLRVWRVK